MQARSANLPLAAPSRARSRCAVFFGGGPVAAARSTARSSGSAPARSLDRSCSPSGVPRGFAPSLPLFLLAAWCGSPSRWSWLPDRSWDYANRALLYALFATLGLWFAGRRGSSRSGSRRSSSRSSCGRSSARCFPRSTTTAAPTSQRVCAARSVSGTSWRCSADFALVLALWLRGRRGTLARLRAGSWRSLLTYSRGGLLTAAARARRLVHSGDERVEGGVGAWWPRAARGGRRSGSRSRCRASRPTARRSHAPARRDRLRRAAPRRRGRLRSCSTRLPRPADTSRLRRACRRRVVVAVAVAAVVRRRRGTSFTSSAEVGEHPGKDRLDRARTSAGTWWQQAWQGFVHHGQGTGAGSFQLTNKLYRTI